MKPRLALVLAALSLAQGGVAAAKAAETDREFNAWPLLVERASGNPATAVHRASAGPLLFQHAALSPAGTTVTGVRPFWVTSHTPSTGEASGHVLYPLLNWTRDETSFRWSLFELIRRQGPLPGQPAPMDESGPNREFEVFPFWFERDFADPARSYRALFPIYGTVRDKLWLERASWTIFPLWFESERRGAVTTHTPWPFVRVTRGAARGWGVWPLYTTYERPGVQREQYALWPLIYRSTRQPHPDDPPGTALREEAGVLPFYSRATGPGFVSENYLWPFFGYTDRTHPVPYQEKRYLWPLFVQGRGENRFTNRWAPFYTHSGGPEREKRWYVWPLLRQAQWTEEGIERSRHQFLYFVFWHEQQRAAGRPQSPVAQLTHLWPLLSRWDNGAGRRQWQLLSPFDVFFPGNQKIRQAWTPLFALARHDQAAPGQSRTSLLWDAITWESRADEDRREFHLGPILGISRAGPAARVTLGHGLLGFHRDAAGGWSVRWFDFPSRRPTGATE